MHHPVMGLRYTALTVTEIARQTKVNFLMCDLVTMVLLLVILLLGLFWTTDKAHNEDEACNNTDY